MKDISPKEITVVGHGPRKGPWPGKGHTMVWSIIRRATEEDVKRLDAAQKRFEQRHGIDLDTIYMDCSETGYGGGRAVNYKEAKYLWRLWLRVVRRALGEENAEGIAWGHVGYGAA